jgi:hypothetical protein
LGFSNWAVTYIKLPRQHQHRMAITEQHLRGFSTVSSCACTASCRGTPLLIFSAARCCRARWTHCFCRASAATHICNISLLRQQPHLLQVLLWHSFVVILCRGTVLVSCVFLIFFQNQVHIAYLSASFESHSHSLSTTSCRYLSYETSIPLLDRLLCRFSECFTLCGRIRKGSKR